MIIPRWLTFTILVLITSISTAENKLTIQEIIKNDIWALAEGTDSSNATVIRFRSEFGNKPNITGYPHLIQITWSYTSSSSGMPDKLASEKMSVFEDRLINAVEPDINAVLVAVRTNGGERVWVFYSSNVREFGNRLTQMPQEKERYPIGLTTKEDPEWSFFYNIILPGVSSG